MFQSENIEEYQPSIDEIEQEFNEKVRVNVIVLLTFISLFVFSYLLLLRFHKKSERDDWYNDVDAKVHRISLYICAFTMSISCGAFLMLPMSMVGNEVVHLYPHSYWVQWLNGALIHSLWELIYILSNLSLFLLIPFSYLFIEAEGFPGYRRGLMPRVYETITVLMLILVIGFGIASILISIFEADQSFLNLMKMIGFYYLSCIYSLFLFAWILFTLVCCTPLGLSIIFDRVGSLLVKPKIFGDNEIKIQQILFTEDAIKRRLKTYMPSNPLTDDEKRKLGVELNELEAQRHQLERQKKVSAIQRNFLYPLLMLFVLAITALSLFLVVIHILKLLFIGDHELHPSTVRDEYGSDYRNAVKHNACLEMEVRGEEQPEYCRVIRNKKEQVLTSSTPTSSSFSFFWSSSSSQQHSDFNSHLYSLGANSLSMFGIVGTCLEVSVILYIFLGSLVGLYSFPGLRKLVPRREDTSITVIIINCLLLQLLACSLPVLSRVLGITDFELQGNFGRIEWLGNFASILLVNLIFAFETCFCLVQNFSSKIQRELIKAYTINKNNFHNFVEKTRPKKFSLQNSQVDSASANSCAESNSPCSKPEADVKKGECGGGDSIHNSPPVAERPSMSSSIGICSPTTLSLTLMSSLSPLKLFAGASEVPVVGARHFMPAPQSPS